MKKALKRAYYNCFFMLNNEKNTTDKDNNSRDYMSKAKPSQQGKKTMKQQKAVGDIVTKERKVDGTHK
jgi:hypothetical protein